ncbi:MAG TPA: hypothetical protein VIQ03_15395 [Gammaproteobacteria bacterium]
MNKKRILTRITILMSLIGAMLIAYPFVNSFSISEKSLNDSIVTCSVKEMKPGEIIECNFAAIYKRTEKDKEYINKFAYLLADPQSIFSKQPISSKNDWRSENPDYFIFYAWAPKRGCPVGYHEPKAHGDIWYQLPEVEALELLPYFTEQCEGRTWDTSGRLYHREGYPDETNLTVPRTKWISSVSVHIYGG